MRPAVVQAIFSAPRPAARIMLPKPLLRVIIIPVIQHRPVITRKNHNRILQQPQALQARNRLTHTPIRLHDSIPARPQVRTSDETGMRRPRHMRLMQPIIKEKRLLSTLLLQPRLHLGHKIIRHILVHPPGLLPAFHKPDPRNPVHNRVIMPVVPHHFQHLRVAQRRRLALKILLIIHINRIIGLQALHNPVPNINRRHAIVRRGNQASIIEPHGIRARHNLLIPINIPVAHSEVPFPDRSGIVARRLHHLRQRRDVRRNQQGSVSRQDFRVRVPPRIQPREHRVPARSRRRRSRIPVGKPDPAARQRIDIRRLDQSVPVSADVAHPEIVGHNQKNIRLLRSLLSAPAARCRHRDRRQSHCQFSVNFHHINQLVVPKFSAPSAAFAALAPSAASSSAPAREAV